MRRSTVEQLRRALSGARRPVGLVPTMGALHEGHLSLVSRARDECATVVASVFVNPWQFGPGEDFSSYPRDLERDTRLLAAAGVDVVFAPDTAAFAPAERATTVYVAGLTEILEGASRPGHFDGVTTIVAKLLHAAGPDRAYFGEKDYQQLLVLRRMVADLDWPVQAVGCPIVREADGLARSSRNGYLDAEQRRRARAVPEALAAARDGWDGDAVAARSRMCAVLEAAGLEVDYAEVCDPSTLEPLTSARGPARALVAVTVGTTRLIDNARLPGP